MYSTALFHNRDAQANKQEKQALMAEPEVATPV